MFYKFAVFEEPTRENAYLSCCKFAWLKFLFSLVVFSFRFTQETLCQPQEQLPLKKVPDKMVVIGANHDINV